MLMPKKNRVAIYEALFKDGVLVAEKKFVMEKHPEVEVPNLHVVKAMQVKIQSSGPLLFVSCRVTSRPLCTTVSTM